MEIPKRPNFSEYEPRIYKMWEKAGYFTPHPPLTDQGKLPKKKPFTIIMPPPNANAPIHVGFGVNVSIEDLMARYYRMRGDPTLWLPGSDHAGILSQVVYERQLAEKGLTRYDLGRKEFFKEVMKFTLGNKEIMQSQVRALGASCDWTRNSFTLDPKFDKLVYGTFKKLYDDGLIYRGERIINWCPRCQTALSDLEVEYQEEKSKLWFIQYSLASTRRVKDSKPVGFITVATTRPETMLGDTAVAVNPKDKRYKDLIGKTVKLPLVNREIPIIADEAVEKEFGTGAVKITPAHDPTDFEIGQKHKLPSIQVVGFDDKMTFGAGDYARLSKIEAREKVLSDLRKLKLLEKEEDYTHSVGHCERCKETIEPLVSMQWFVKTKPLAKPAIEAVKKGKIKIIPKRFEKTYFNWMENIHDWCISRQIWWGHRLPVWYCLNPDCSHLSEEEINKLCEEKGVVLPVVKREIYSKLKPIVSIEKPKKCPDCGGSNLYRDPDTLDTWFSSGQWPVNTLKSSPYQGDFEFFYPTSVMETGYEILFFWVARMIMLGLYATGEVPFKTVYLHGMVRDAFGQKMSKSRPETCIDPMDAIKEYGADALRMALVLGNAPGTDSSLSKEKIKGMRNFVTKLWNLGRFILSSFDQLEKEVPFYSREMEGNLGKEDKAIVSDLNNLIEKVTKLLDKYRFDLAAEELYYFIWHRFADEYVEHSKDRINKNDIVVLSILRHVYLNCLKLLHPFMPFVTEEIWQKFPRKYDDPIIVSKWPEPLSTRRVKKKNPSG